MKEDRIILDDFEPGNGAPRGPAVLLATVLAVAGTACDGGRPARRQERPAQGRTVIGRAREAPPAGRRYNEAPMLAERVARGLLPPVEERLPEEPMVIQPLEEIGRYGGSWHGMMRGSADYHSYGRRVFETMVHWPRTPDQPILPGLVAEWAFSEGARVLTLRLRKGLKWSDGHPFTADDVLFWWEGIAADPELSGGTEKTWSPGGKPMKLERVDELTLVLRFAAPYPRAIEVLATKGYQWPLAVERDGFFAPRHYLAKYLPARGASQADYAAFEARASDFNPRRPVMSAWRVVQWDPGRCLIAERNPYYWKVDPAGNQLPYLDRIEMEVFVNPEMVHFRALAGELQMTQGIKLEALDLLREFAPRRGYRIIQYEQTKDSAIALNLTYGPSAAIRQVFGDRRFRRALSLAIDRGMICRLAFRGLARPAEHGLWPESPDHVKVEGLPDYLRYDPAAAGRLLEEMGLGRRDQAGWRVGPDGRALSLVMEIVGSTVEANDAMEIVRSNWEAVGLKTSLRLQNLALYGQRRAAGELMIDARGGKERVLPMSWPNEWFGTHQRSCWARRWGLWHLTGGRQGERPPPEVERLQQIHERLKLATDPAERRALWTEVIRSHAENLWTIPLADHAIVIGVAADNFRNVPERAFQNAIVMTPGNLNTETFFHKD